MPKRLVKILIVGVALILCIGLFAVFGRKEKIEFERGEAWAISGELPIAKIISSLSDISDDSKRIPEKYDSNFFELKSLVIVSFGTSSGGGQIEEINAFRRGSKLIIEINGSKGMQSVLSGHKAVLEVKKSDIKGIKKVTFTTNMGA